MKYTVAVVFFVLGAWSESATAFTMMGPNGIDLESGALMQSCRVAAEDAALDQEVEIRNAGCATVPSQVISKNTRLNGLALDRRGFVYEVDVLAGCNRVVRYEVVVGPASNGRSCQLLSTPIPLGTWQTPTNN